MRHQMCQGVHIQTFMLRGYEHPYLQIVRPCTEVILISDTEPVDHFVDGFVRSQMYQGMHISAKVCTMHVVCAADMFA